MSAAFMISWLMSPGPVMGWGGLALAFLAGAGLVGLPVVFRVWHLSRLKGRLAAQVAGLTQDLERTNRTLQDALAALENENFTDPLTELRNRRYISAVIRADVARVQRIYRDFGPELQDNQDLVFFLVDLDHFSRINDFYGVPLGDQALQGVAMALRRIMRETDSVIRWGGDEFLIVVRNASRKEAPEVAERIRTVIAGLSMESPTGEVLRWTCCVGFAAFPFQTTDFGWLGWDRVVEIADSCMNVAKKSGRNAWVGVQSRPGLDRVQHGALFPKDLGQLVDEGLLDVFSSRNDPFGKSNKIGEILG
jgi:diguanylate cyclase (GGDEF)-like protein